MGYLDHANQLEKMLIKIHLRNFTASSVSASIFWAILLKAQRMRANCTEVLVVVLNRRRDEDLVDLSNSPVGDSMRFRDWGNYTIHIVGILNSGVFNVI